MSSYSITIDGRTYGSTRVSGGSSDPFCEACLLLSDTGLELVPVNKKTADMAPSRSEFADYSDTEDYIWIPFPYRNFDCRWVDEDATVKDRRNIFHDILTGVLNKSNIGSVSGFMPNDRAYIVKHFDEYKTGFVKMMLWQYAEQHNIQMDTDVVNVVAADLSKEFDKLGSMTEGEVIKIVQDATSKATSGKTQTQTSTTNPTARTTTKAQRSTPQPEPQTSATDTQQPESPKQTANASPTAQVIQSLIGSGQTKVIKRSPDDQSSASVVTDNGDGSVTVDFSNLPVQQNVPVAQAQVQDGAEPLVNVPAGTPSQPTMTTSLTPPPVETASMETISPTTRTTKAKTDVVDNPPQATVIPESCTIDPLTGIQETESDKLLAKYPQLKLYKDCVGDQFTCEFYLNGKLVSVRVRDKNAAPTDPDIATLGATFDVAGAIISPETNKFWAGNDPDIIYDFEVPLKLTENVVRAYLNGETFTEDMYYSNSSVCELNKQFNVRSVWEFVTDSDQAAETMQHIKKLLGMPKAKQVKKKLTGRRLSMDGFTDSTHFVLMTHPGTPDYLGGVKVNEGKQMFKLTINGDDLKLESVKIA